MTRFELYDLEGDDELSGARRVPERANHQVKSQRSPKRARRNRSNDTAKRGMHQRRNKRTAW